MYVFAGSAGQSVASFARLPSIRAKNSNHPEPDTPHASASILLTRMADAVGQAVGRAVRPQPIVFDPADDARFAEAHPQTTLPIGEQAPDLSVGKGRLAVRAPCDELDAVESRETARPSNPQIAVVVLGERVNE